MIRLLLLFAIIMAFSSGSAKETTDIIRIAVIDTGFTKSSLSKVHICGTKDFTGTSIKDNHGHGTHITNLIDIKADTDRTKYCFIIIKAFDMQKNKQYVPEALEYLVKLKPNIVNLSLGGPGVIHKEYKAVQKLLNQGTVLVAASGNEGDDLEKDCNYFPACYDKRIIVVGNSNKSSNYGKKIVDIVLDGNNINVLGKTMTGSSQSTAIFTGLSIKNLLHHKKQRR